MNNHFIQKLSELRSQMLLLPLEQFWQVGEEAGLYLKDKIAYTKPKKVLEIGTSSGYSTTWLLQGLDQQASKLISIESNKNRFEISQAFLSQLDLGKTVLQQVRHHAPEVFPSLDLLNLDFVFCDAIKKQTLELFLILKPFMTQQGVFIVDNAISHKDSMQDFYDYLVTNHIEYALIDKGSGLLEVDMNQFKL